MNILFVDNFIMPDGRDHTFFDVHPHLGLISLAAVLQREGHTVSIYDPKREVRFGRHPYDQHLYERASEDILNRKPDAVGFTTLGCSFLFAVKVAQLLKVKEPHLPVLLGGPHATMLDREILNSYHQFDVVVRHEAEETLPFILSHLETRAFEDVPGVTWRTGRDGQIKTTPGLPKIENLDSLPIGLYDLYPIRDLELAFMRVEAGRGCPFACTFCSTSSFFQRSYRLKTPSRILAEMDLLHSRYGVSEFKLDHDLFTVDRRKVLAFCEAVANKGYQWRVSARTDCVDDELLEKMALAGCVGLYFGIETGSRRMQKISQKRLELEGVDHTLDTAASLGIETTVSFITGYPEETKQDQADTLDMLGLCFQRPQEMCIPQLHILLPEPGTPMFAQFKGSLTYDGYVTKFNARLMTEDDGSHIREFPALYSSYYYYPAAMPRANYTFAVEAVDAFRSVGQDVLGYALRFYEFRLSKLIDDFRSWIDANKPNVPLDAHIVSDFVSARFGPTHHLTSLFRLGAELVDLAQDATITTDMTIRDTHFDPSIAYVLSPNTSVLADSYDCGRLLSRVRDLPRQAGPLRDSELGERVTYMVVTDGKMVTHYAMDPGVDTILRLFDEPRTVWEVEEFLRELTVVAPDESIFRELVNIGALVPATAQSVQQISKCEVTTGK
jgi:radical SAM superfamily enzyme YgiQ (UPF0313 family)